MLDFKSAGGGAAGGIIGAPLGYIARDEVTDWDFEVGDFTKDDGWHDLDLSSIVPETAQVVVMRWDIGSSVVNRYIYLRQDGFTDVYANWYARTWTTTVGHPFFPSMPIGPNGVIEYRAHPANITLLNCTVLGWWI